MNAVAALRRRIDAKRDPHGLLNTPLAAYTLGTAQLVASHLPFPVARKLSLLSAASRRFTRGFMLERCRRALQPWLTPEKVDAWRAHQIGWQRYYGSFGAINSNRALTTSLLLKEPGPNGEKGVLYCSFEFNWMKLLANHDIRRFLADYLLVGASSYSPGDHRVMASLCGLAPDPLFIGISNRTDIAQYDLFAPWIRPVPIMACDWLDEDNFHPVPQRERSIDILMVAHFAHLKRHWILFEALSKMRPDLRVTLIGRPGDGRTAQSLRDDAKAFGVPQELTIVSNAEFDEVTNHLCNAKVSLVLTRREGSCVSVTESMFADTPVILMERSHIGSGAYINRHTGRFATRATLPQTLTELIEHPGLCSPRAWAIDNISARIASRKLNTILKQHCMETGQPWTRDIAPLCWRYVPRYLDSIDALRLRGGVDRLREQHGIVLEEFVSEQHALQRHRRAS
ncbi:MAG TPA: glycosyltransferase [Pseudomonadales bacterium]